MILFLFLFKAYMLLLLLRPVLWWGSLLGGTAPGLHLSVLRQDGLHGDLSAGARGCRAHGDLHRSGERLFKRWSVKPSVSVRTGPAAGIHSFHPLLVYKKLSWLGECDALVALDSASVNLSTSVFSETKWKWSQVGCTALFIGTRWFSFDCEGIKSGDLTYI